MIEHKNQVQKYFKEKSWFHLPDLPPENESNYNIVKEEIDGQKVIHTGADHLKTKRDRKLLSK